MFRKVLVAISAMALLSAGAAEAKKKPTMTPMELQAIQSKEFEVTKDDLFSAVMTVTQDLGYQVESADLQTGFITAASATENKTGFFEAMAGMSASGNTRMTAFIQQMPNKMSKVRLNFLNSKNSSSAYGRNSSQDKPILDPAVYNNAWEKIDEAIFVINALNDGDAAGPKAQPPVTPEADIQANATTPAGADSEAVPQTDE
jgi:hypothetical protein